MFRLRQNKRLKSRRLVASPEEGLIYETPKEPSKKQAQRYVKANKDWVLKTIRQLERKQSRVRELKQHNQSLLIGGVEKPVSIKMNQKRASFLETSTHIHLGFAANKIRKVEVEERLEAWMKERASRTLPLRTRILSHNNFTYKKVLVKNHKTLWGSCTHDKTINLNWRLVMAPQDIQDYVILHELTHTEHMNHSTAFWKRVKAVCPQTDAAEKWLKSYGFLLHTNLFF